VCYVVSWFVACLIVWADFCSCFCVCGFSLSCMIFSMPFLPRITGTPIEMSSSPYSPCRMVDAPITRFLALSMASVIMAMTAAGA